MVPDLTLAASDGSPILFALPLLWVAGWIVGSIIYRRHHGKPVFPDLPPDALFAERATSGRSLRSLVTRFGGARNAIHVGVTREALVVTPFFPFNLMFMPEIFGLEAAIPRRAILAVEERKPFFPRSWTLTPTRTVRVTFQNAAGGEEALEFDLRDAAGFLRALGR